MHQGNGFILAETGGAEEITLTVNQIPAHTHPLLASADASNQRVPTDLVLGRGAADAYARQFTPGNLAPSSVGPVGGSQPHTNFQPYLCVDFIISLFGIFPSPT